MYFNVARLMKEPSGSRRTFEVDEELVVEGAGPQRVKATVDLLRTDAGIWVSAALDSEVRCTCSRCLKEHSQPIHMVIEEEFLPLADSEDRAGANRRDNADEGSGIDVNNTLDLTEAVGQYHALNIPMKPVCREDCKGMCLSCGADLNESGCRCDNPSGDKAWGPLLELVASYKSTEVVGD